MRDMYRSLSVLFFFKQKTAYEMRISDWSSDVCSSDLRNAAFRQHFLKVAIADRIATIPAHRPQDHITLEMAPLEIRHRSVRPISAKHAQASRFLQQSPTDGWKRAPISSCSARRAEERATWRQPSACNLSRMEIGRAHV